MTGFPRVYNFVFHVILLCLTRYIFRFKPSANGTIQYEISTGVFLRKSVWKTVDLSKNEYCLDGVMKRISSCGSTNNNHFPSTTATNFHQKQEPIQQYNVHVGSEGRHVEINNVENEVINKDNSDRTGSFYKKCDNSGDDGGNSEYNDNEPTMDSILFVCLKDDNYSPEASSVSTQAQNIATTHVYTLGTLMET